MTDMLHSPPKASSIRVGFVDGDATTRDAVRWLLQTSPGIEFVDAFASPKAALPAVKASLVQVLVSEFSFGGEIITDWLPRLKGALPAMAVLVYSGSGDARRVTKSLSDGASGFLLKSDPPWFLLEAIRAAYSGGMPISPYLTRFVLDEAGPRAGQMFRDENIALSPRERQMLEGLARGLRYSDLAAELGISIETVRTHLRRTYAKLKVGCRSEAIAKYIRGQAFRVPLAA